ncbi:MAG: cyclic nucleotide-binding domain-containing protein [Deltaproteobacteria bacterium]|nr:cyclic nucleotide-binding domain-containing protein [Deltaproteobacteria bacterium]
MRTVPELLGDIPWFRRVPRDELRRVAGHFLPESLVAGQVLWRQGEAVSELGILVEGELVASLDGAEVGRVRAPDLVGEASAFFLGATRTATLAADRDATVLVLPTPDLRALRFQRSEVYACLLDQALRALVRRVGHTSREIAKHATGGNEQPRRAEPGVLARLWRTLRPGAPSMPCPPLGPLLRRMPGLGELVPEVEDALAAAFVPQSYAEGEVIVLEGESSNALWLVADGEIDVLRNVRGDRAELLTKLRAGQQFGMNTMIEMGPRTASCVAVTAGWLFRMDRAAWDALDGEAASRWRESVLATLASQIRNANGALARALGARRVPTVSPRPSPFAKSAGASVPPPGGPYPGATGPRVAAVDGFSELLRASGYLETLPADEAELENLSFTVDEDTRRRGR